MRPAFTGDNSMDLGFPQAVFLSKGRKGNGSRQISSTDVKHVLICQVGSPVERAFTYLFRVGLGAMSTTSCGSFWLRIATALKAFCASAFPGHISHVVGRGTLKKVGGVTARPVVARVANHKSAWIFFVVNPICDSVRSPRKALNLSNAVLKFLSAMADPRPAIIRLSGLDSSQKPSYCLRRKFGKLTMWTGHDLRLLNSLGLWLGPLRDSRLCAGRFVL